MTNAIIIERLSRIKYLFQLGVEQSKKPERVAYSSILLFHDSIDMFMQLAGEVKNIRQSERHKLAMMQFFDKIPELTLQASVSKINDRRNSLKHNGQIPAKIDIEESRIIAGLFFEQNTPLIFGLEFKDVDIYDLITYDRIRAILKKADKSLKDGNKKDAVINVTIAFHELISIDPELLINDKAFLIVHDYKPIDLPVKLVPAFEEISTLSNVRMKLEKFDSYFEEVVRIHNENIVRIEDAMKIISLGLDFRKYSKFKMITPHLRLDQPNIKYYVNGLHEELYTDDNLEFIFDFVLDSAIKMQDFSLV